GCKLLTKDENENKVHSAEALEKGDKTVGRTANAQCGKGEAPAEIKTIEDAVKHAQKARGALPNAIKQAFSIELNTIRFTDDAGFCKKVLEAEAKSEGRNVTVKDEALACFRNEGIGADAEGQGLADEPGVKLGLPVVYLSKPEIAHIHG